MEYTVIVSERAKQMLSTHLKFLANTNRSAAKDTKKRMIEGLASLNKLPMRYPFFGGDYIPPNKYHKMYIENWYLVLFQVRDNVVYVDYILDCRQDYSWLAK